MSNYTTGEMAKLCGVSVRTVQYYDTRGILVPTALTEGGRRLYSEEDLSRMRTICFLRELDMSIDTIASLLKEENSAEVIAVIFEEQEARLTVELAQKKHQLERIRGLRAHLAQEENFSPESIGDAAQIMENKKMMRRLHTVLLLTGIPMAVVEWAAIALWIAKGIWWPFLVYTALAVPYGVWVSRYYFSRVSYICPHCHEIFVPRFWQAFWAAHTPMTRKLTCPGCGHRGYCVETYREKPEENT